MIVQGHNPYSFDFESFTSVCRFTLNEYFEHHGLVESDVLCGGGVRYSSPLVYFDVNYEYRNYPRYAPLLSLGFAEDREHLGVGLVPPWYLIPKSSPAQDYGAWYFVNKEDLEAVLLRVQNEVLIPYVEPYFTDMLALDRVIRAFDKSFRETS